MLLTHTVTSVIVCTSAVASDTARPNRVIFPAGSQRCVLPMPSYAKHGRPIGRANSLRLTVISFYIYYMENSNIETAITYRLSSKGFLRQVVTVHIVVKIL